MSQPTWVVPRDLVLSLVDGFKLRGTPHCSSYNPEGLRAALADAAGDRQEIPFNDVANVLSRFECYKLTGGCNRWTTWMRHQLREAKYVQG